MYTGTVLYINYMLVKWLKTFKVWHTLHQYLKLLFDFEKYIKKIMMIRHMYQEIQYG